MSVLASYLF